MEIPERSKLLPFMNIKHLSISTALLSKSYDTIQLAAVLALHKNATDR